MTNFTVAITSDTVCPWCYVGKNKLEAGIKAYNAAQPTSNDTFEVSWHPFYLNPDAPKKGTDKQAVYESKFGADRTAAIQERLSREGSKVGIKFKYGGKTGNTRDSHRLIQMAGKTGGAKVQNRVVEELFKDYFEEEKDITDLQVLKEAALNAGLEEASVNEWLGGNAGGPEVDAEVKEARAGLVTGVPHFVINGKYEIQGAQDAEGFRRVFERIKEIGG